MKNKILYLLMLTAFIGYSQEKTTDSIATKKFKIDGYFGFNGNVNDNTNLNKKLNNANLPELDNFVPELTFGLNYFGQKSLGLK